MSSSPSPSLPYTHLRPYASNALHGVSNTTPFTQEDSNATADIIGPLKTCQQTAVLSKIKYEIQYNNCFPISHTTHVGKSQEQTTQYRFQHLTLLLTDTKTSRTFRDILSSSDPSQRTADIIIYYYNVLKIFRINTSSTCRKNTGVSSSVLESQLLLIWAMIFSFLLTFLLYRHA